MKNLLFLSMISVFALCSASKCNSGGASSSCVDEDNLGKESACFAVTVLAQGNPFPNPVSVGNTLSLNMKIAAVGSNPFAPIPATITTKVFSYSTGQLVAQLNAGTVQSNNVYQNVPIWTNVNVAAALYYVEVSVNAGACGTKTICLKDFKINVVR